MKEEIRRILDMNKSGKINEEQATELLAALTEPERLGPTAEASDFGDSQLENRSILSKVDRVDGSEFVFADNTINVSSVSGLQMRKSHFRDNAINASKLSSFSMEEAQFTDCAVQGSALDGIEIKQSGISDVSFNGSKVSHLAVIDQCAINDVKFEGCSVKNLSLKNQSRIHDSKFTGFSAAAIELVKSSIVDTGLEGAAIQDLKMRNSHWQDVSQQAVRYDSVDFIDSSFRDCHLSGRDRKRHAGFKAVKFQNTHFNDVKIINCLFENVHFMDLNLRGVKLENLELRGKMIRTLEELMREALKRS